MCADTHGSHGFGGESHATGARYSVRYAASSAYAGVLPLTAHAARRDRARRWRMAAAIHKALITSRPLPLITQDIRNRIVLFRGLCPTALVAVVPGRLAGLGRGNSAHAFLALRISARIQCQAWPEVRRCTGAAVWRSSCGLRRLREGRVGNARPSGRLPMQLNLSRASGGCGRLRGVCGGLPAFPPGSSVRGPLAASRIRVRIHL
jgi:hypothetical protein